MVLGAPGVHFPAVRRHAGVAHELDFVFAAILHLLMEEHHVKVLVMRKEIVRLAHVQV